MKNEPPIEGVIETTLTAEGWTSITTPIDRDLTIRMAALQAAAVAFSATQANTVVKLAKSFEEYLRGES